MTSYRTGTWPPPIYEAHYDDGEVVRLSFHWPKNKPLDPCRGRRGCDLIYAGEIWRKLHAPTVRYFAALEHRRDEWGSEYDRVGDDTLYEITSEPLPGSHLDPKLFAAEADFRRTYPAPFSRGFVEHPDFGRLEDDGGRIISASNVEAIKTLRNTRPNWRKACESALSELEKCNITKALEILRACKERVT